MESRLNSRTRTLAQEQSQLAARIFGATSRSGPFRRGEGIAVYRRNLLAVAVAALRVTYPTACSLLGQSTFEGLAADLLDLHPPTRGDWGEWGEELPLVIERAAPARKFPFIAPVAELDWLRHRANRAADNQFDPSTAGLLQSHRVDGIGIGLARHVGLIHSIYPLVEIHDWHVHPAMAREEFQVSASPRPVLVYRREFRVEQEYISNADYLFLRGLAAGRSVGSLLDELDGQDFDFSDWIARAIDQNLINHLYLI